MSFSLDNERFRVVLVPLPINMKKDKLKVYLTDLDGRLCLIYVEILGHLCLAHNRF
jgi:hypothetical protein